MICGDRKAIFRSRTDGYWVLDGGVGLKAADVADGDATNQELWDQFASIGQQFVSGLSAEHDCIILTIAPWNATRWAEANAIADALSLNLIAPDLEGLATFDGSHLDSPSRERWATAFFEAAGPQIRQCLNRPRQAQ
jgi:hypothetical protein